MIRRNRVLRHICSLFPVVDLKDISEDLAALDGFRDNDAGNALVVGLFRVKAEGVVLPRPLNKDLIFVETVRSMRTAEPHQRCVFGILAFDIDKRIIRRAAESQNPEEKTLMWFCRPHGTHCLNENQVFIQGTRDHNTFRFYAEQTYDECVARVIIPKTLKHGKVFGDVFEINYQERAANVAQNSVAPDHDRLTFADGFVLDAPCRSSFDAAMALVGEHGRCV